LYLVNGALCCQLSDTSAIYLCDNLLCKWWPTVLFCVVFRIRCNSWGLSEHCCVLWSGEKSLLGGKILLPQWPVL